MKLRDGYLPARPEALYLLKHISSRMGEGSMRIISLASIVLCAASAAVRAEMPPKMMDNAIEFARLIGKTTGEDVCKSDSGNADRTMDLFLRLAKKCGATSEQDEELTQIMEQEHASYSGEGCVDKGQDAFWFLIKLMGGLEHRLYAAGCRESFDPAQFPSP